MIRNGIAPIVLVLGTSLLGAQVLGGDTGPGATKTKSGPSSAETAGGLWEGKGGLGSPAPKKPQSGSLEDLIDKALKNNADIRAAEAKVREAEAELNRVRHQIVAKVATLKHDITTAKKMLEFAEKQVALVTETYRKGAANQQEVHAALAAVEKQKADVARLETEMQTLTGSWKTAISAAFTGDGWLIYTGTADGAIRVWNTVSGQAVAVREGETLLTIDLPQTPMAGRIKAALDKTVRIDKFEEEVPFADALALLVQKAGVDVPFRPIGKLDNARVTLMKAELPLGAWLQALEDSAGNIRFVVREYGILVTADNRIPQGAVTVQEFWKRGDKPKSDSPKGMTPSGSGPKTP